MEYEASITSVRSGERFRHTRTCKLSYLKNLFEFVTNFRHNFVRVCAQLCSDVQAESTASLLLLNTRKAGLAILIVKAHYHEASWMSFKKNVQYVLYSILTFRAQGQAL